MTTYEFLDKIESLTFELLENRELDPEKIDHIADRINCTFYEVVDTLKEKQETNK